MLKKILKSTFVFLIVFFNVFVLIFGIWFKKENGENYYRYTYAKKNERLTVLNFTNKKALYSEDKIKEIISNYFDVDDSVLDTIIDKSIVIPGLHSTRTLKENTSNEMSICTSMTPQGIVMSESYIFISAYCYTKEHNSVIYVLDKDTHEFIKEIILPDKSHVGSIAYDDVNQNIWVCCYEENKKLAFVCSISMSSIEQYSFDEYHLPIKYDMQYQIDTQKRSSFMNYHDGSLYIGYFEKAIDQESTIQQFQITEDGGLKTTSNLMSDVYDDEPDEYALPTSLFYINGNAQGMDLDDETIVITQSYGSKNDSELKVFSNTKNKDGNVDARNHALLNSITLPVMAEDCYMDEEGNLYICFESAAFSYRYRECDHLDRVLFIPRELYS